MSDVVKSAIGPSVGCWIVCMLSYTFCGVKYFYISYATGINFTVKPLVVGCESKRIISSCKSEY